MVESERLAKLEASHDDLKSDVRDMAAKVNEIVSLDQTMRITQAEMAGDIKLLVSQTSGLPERVAKLELARATGDAYRDAGVGMGKAVGHVATASAGGMIGWLLNHFWKA